MLTLLYCETRRLPEARKIATRIHCKRKGVVTITDHSAVAEVFAYLHNENEDEMFVLVENLKPRRVSTTQMLSIIPRETARKGTILVCGKREGKDKTVIDKLENLGFTVYTPEERLQKTQTVQTEANVILEEEGKFTGVLGPKLWHPPQERDLPGDGRAFLAWEMLKGKQSRVTP